jgi:type II secretory pathway pseudopilin PulG
VIRRSVSTGCLLARPRRAGLSLLEVVVALAILAFSIGAIGQLISMSTDRAVEVEREAQGSLLCQRKLAELLIGPNVPASSGYASFPDDEPSLQYWQWKADVNPGANDLVYQVQVSVQYDSGDGRTVEIQLGQMLLDPTQRGSNQDPTANTNNSLNAVVQTPSGNGSSGSAASGAAGTGAAPTGGGAAPAPASSKTPAPAAATPAAAVPAAAPAAKNSSGGNKGS